MATINGVDWTVNVKSFIAGTTTDITTATYSLDGQYGDGSRNHTGIQPYEIWAEKLTLQTAGDTQLSGNHTLYDGPGRAVIIRVASKGSPTGASSGTTYDAGSGSPYGFDVTYGGVTPTLIGEMHSSGGVYGNQAIHLYYILEADLPAGNGPHSVVIEPNASNTSMTYYGVGVSQLVGIEQVAPSGFSSDFNDDGGDNEVSYFFEYFDGTVGDGSRARFDYNTATLEANSIIIAANARSRQGSAGYSVVDRGGGSQQYTTGIWQDRTSSTTAGSQFVNVTDNLQGEGMAFHPDNDFASWNKLIYCDVSSSVGQVGIAARWNRGGSFQSALTQRDGTTAVGVATGEVSASHTPSAGTNRVIVAHVVSEQTSGIPDLSAVTYGGVNMTEVVSLGDINASRGNQTTACYVLLEADIPTGAGPFTVTTVHSSAPDHARIAVQQYSGVAQEIPTGSSVVTTTRNGSGDTTLTMSAHEPGSLVTAAAAANIEEQGTGHELTFTYDGPYEQISQEATGGSNGLTTAYVIPVHAAPMDWDFVAFNQSLNHLIAVTWRAASQAGVTGTDLTSYTQGIQIDQMAPVGRPSQSRASIRLDNSTGIFTPGLGKTFSNTDWFSLGMFIEATVPGETTSVVFHGIVREFSLADDSTNSYVDVKAVDALSLAARGPVAEFPTGFSGTTQDVVEGLMSAAFVPVDDGIALPTLGTSTSSFDLTEVPVYPANLRAEGTDLSLRGSARTIIDNHVLPSGPMVLFSTRIAQQLTNASYEAELIGPVGVKSLSGGGRKTYQLTDDQTDTAKLYFSKLKFDFLTSDIVNRCKVTRISPSAVTQGAQTPSSIEKYGVRAKDFPQVVCQTDSDAFSIAAYWASRFSDPKFEILEIDLGYTNASIATSGSATQKADLASLLDIRSSLWTQVALTTESFTGNPDETVTPSTSLSTITGSFTGGTRMAVLAARVDPLVTTTAVASLGTNATNVEASAGASPPDYSFSHTLVAGGSRIVLIAVMGESTGTPDDSVTYGGVAASFLAEQQDGSSVQFTRWHYVLESSLPADGSNTVTVSRTNTGAQTCWVGAFSGALQSAPTTGGGSSSSSTATTASIATVGPGSLALTAGSARGPAGTVPPSPLGTDATRDFGNGTGYSFSHTLAAGTDRIVLIMVTGEQSGVTVTATYGGVSATAMTVDTDPAGTQYNAIFYVLEADLPADGSNTVTITKTNSTAYASAWVGAFEDVNQAAPTKVTGNASSGTTVTTSGLTTTEDNCIIVAAGNANEDTFPDLKPVSFSWTPGTTWTDLFTTDTQTLLTSVQRTTITSAVTSQAITFTLSQASNRLVASAVALESTGTATSTGNKLSYDDSPETIAEVYQAETFDAASDELATAIGSFTLDPEFDQTITQTRDLTIVGRQIRVNHKWFGMKLKTRSQFYAGFILDESTLNGTDTI